MECSVVGYEEALTSQAAAWDHTPFSLPLNLARPMWPGGRTERKRMSECGEWRVNSPQEAESFRWRICWVVRNGSESRMTHNAKHRVRQESQKLLHLFFFFFAVLGFEHWA
jgi:hypothetical protein